jgi:hypothetical protein
MSMFGGLLRAIGLGAAPAPPARPIILDPVAFERDRPDYNPAQPNLAQRDRRQAGLDGYIVNAADNINDVAANPFANQIFQGVNFNEGAVDWNQPYPNDGATIVQILQPPTPPGWQPADVQYAAIFVWFLMLATAILVPNGNCLSALYLRYNYRNPDVYREKVAKEQLCFLAAMMAVMFSQGPSWTPHELFPSINSFRSDSGRRLASARSQLIYDGANMFLDYALNDHAWLSVRFARYGITKTKIMAVNLNEKWWFYQQKLTRNGYWSSAFVHGCRAWSQERRLAVRNGLYIGFHRICDSLFENWSYNTDNEYLPRAESLKHAEQAEIADIENNPCIYHRPRLTVPPPAVVVDVRGF